MNTTQTKLKIYRLPPLSILLLLLSFWITVGCQRNALSEQTRLPRKHSSQQPTNPQVNPNVKAERTLQILVMDPLAAPLSCPCVNGFGQRQYDQLRAYLQKKLKRPVKILFEESLQIAFQQFGKNFDFVIGKYSNVVADAEETKFSLRPQALLTDLQGNTHFSGIFVVPQSSNINQLEDAVNQSLVLGPPEDQETNLAAVELLEEAGIEGYEVGEDILDGLFSLLDGDAELTVIPDYLPRLLEGCGKIKPGYLKTVGKTAKVPFISFFAAKSVSQKEAQQVLNVLLQVSQEKKLLAALESKKGFVAWDGPPAKKVTDWTDWRGPQRTGISQNLPLKLPQQPKQLWSAQVTGPALAGIAASEKFVLVADKDKSLENDIFRCFHAKTGKVQWTLKFPAKKEVQYTNAPRATPIVHNGLVYFQGALGDLYCITLSTGKVVWKTNLLKQFQAELLTWGSSSPPLIVDQLLIVNPGAPQASLVALNRLTGKVVWKTPGHAAAYSAFVTGKFKNVPQIIGYDVAGLGGWDPQTGRRLWEVVPPGLSDFNVGTPVIINDHLLVATENNGTRLYSFDQKGRLQKKPIYQNEDLAPDTPTPVVLNNRVFCTAFGQLFCLDLKNQLKTIWVKEDDMFYEHSNLIAGNQRVLIWTTSGDLVLIKADSDQFELVSHLKPFGAAEIESMSHPAIVGDRLYLRSSKKLLCLSLKQSEK